MAIQGLLDNLVVTYYETKITNHLPATSQSTTRPPVHSAKVAIQPIIEVVKNTSNFKKFENKLQNFPSLKM